MMMNYFNDLREHGIIVNSDDTLWIDIFCNYVIENNILKKTTVNKALHKTLKILNEGQTTKDVINLLRKFDIDYRPIDEKYQAAIKKYKELF